MNNRRPGGTGFQPIRRSGSGFYLALVVILLSAVTLPALPQFLGDLDEDGLATVLDLVRLQNHVRRVNVLDAANAFFADINEDGFVNEADVTALANVILGLAPLTEFPLARIRESSPADGEGGVSVNRETIFRLTLPLSSNAEVNTSNLFATFGGRKILSRVEMSTDRKTVTLFYLEPVPASARVRVTFNGGALTDFLGRPVDLDGDGLPGGVARVDFDTLSITSVFGTAVIGHVYASEPVPGTNSTNFVNLPLQGVLVSVDGAEESLWTRTDSNGSFRLEPVPAGRFFVHVDGRSAVGSQWPSNVYYPVVGKAWEAVAGRTNNLAGGSGEIFLPLIQAGSLQAVSATNDTTITFAPSVLASNPRLAGVSINVPANSLFSDNGTRGGMVGIAPVAPDRLPEPLPPGLEFPVVITVQTDGGLNFDQPASACFPNLPDPSTGQPLPPGTKNYLYSFNHDKGVWEAVGPMTVSFDGNFICTDVGVGIRQPGWHGSGPPPVAPPPPPPPCNPSSACCISLTSIITPSGSSLTCEPPPPCPQQPPPNRDCSFCETSYQEKKKQAFDLHFNDSYCNKLEGFRKQACKEGEAVGYWTQIALAYLEYRKCLETCIPKPPPCPRLAVPLSVQKLERETPLTAAASPATLEIDNIASEILILINPYLVANQRLPDAILDQVDQLRAAAVLSSGGNLSAMLRHEALLLEHARTPQEGGSSEPLGNAPDYPILYYAQIRHGQSNLDLRGQTKSRAQYELFVGREDFVRFILFYDPKTKALGIIRPNLRDTALYSLPRPFLFPVDQTFIDLDRDSLPDLVELVYGTGALDPDSDHDGILDGAEVQQGTDPLDGLPVATGVIATADTPGNAVDVCAVNDLAIVADSLEGVVIFNIADRKNLTRIAQVNTPGNARAVACLGNFVAVADDTNGLAIIDITDPPAARILHQVRLGGVAQAVTVDGAIAYVGLASGVVVAVDIASGTVLNYLRTSSAVQDLAINGEFIYILSSSTLQVATLADSDLRIVTTVSAPGSLAAPRRRLFVGGGVAYASHSRGYNIFLLTSPSSPVLQRDVLTTQFGWHQIVANGSGLGIAAMGVNAPIDSSHDVWLYGLNPNGTNSQFLTSLSTPGAAYSVSIYNGLAYAADGANGLQVINYVPYDSQGMPPTIQLAPNFTLNTSTNGAIEEGQTVRLTANVTDDVQVGLVEFYLNGQRVLTDGNFPFEHTLVAPLLSGGASNFTVRARALDTGGNAISSEEIVVNLLPDTTPPQLSRTFPVHAAILGGVDLVAAYFSEPVNPETLSAATFHLVSAGPDGLLQTSDDYVVTNGVLSYREELKGAFLTFSTNLTSGLYEAQLLPPIADRAGNVMTNAYSWFFWVVPGQDADQDGVPDDVELAMGLDPQNPDSNGNGIWDGDEDADGDGLATKWEIVFGYNPLVQDSDGNGLRDDSEDLDQDGLLNRDEILARTNPKDPDTDRDGWNDEMEVTSGTSPLDPTTFPRWHQTARPPVKLLLPSVGEPEFPANTVLGLPPLRFLLPGLSDPILALNTSVARPPVNVLLPSLGTSGGLPANTMVAQPPLRFVLPSNGDSSLPANTTVGQPPVSVKFNPQ